MTAQDEIKLNKIISIIKSCRTIHQIYNASSWADQLYTIHDIHGFDRAPIEKAIWSTYAKIKDATREVRRSGHAALMH